MAKLEHGTLVECVNAKGPAVVERELKKGARYVVWRPMSWNFNGERKHAEGIRVRREGERALVGGRTQHWDPRRFRPVSAAQQ